MIFTSIKTKLTCAVFVLIVAIMAVTTFAALFFFEGKFRESISHDQFALLNAVGTQIDETIFHALVELDAAADSLTPTIVADPARAQQFLDRHGNLLDFYDNSLILFSSSGRLLAANPRQLNFIGKDYSFRDYFGETIRTGKICISAPLDSLQRESNPIIMFTVPVYGEQREIIAVLAGAINLKQHHYLRSMASLKLGRNGFLTLYDSHGTVLMHPHNSRLLQTEPLKSDSLVEKAVKGYEGGVETVSYDGVPVLSSVRLLKSTDWVLEISYPLADAYAPIRAARKYFLAGGLIAALLSVLVVWPLMNSLTRPLRSFTDHLQRLSGLEEESCCFHTRTADETGILAQAFNGMMQELARRKAALIEQKEFAESLVNNSSLPTFVIDTDHKLLFWNKACEELTGVKAAEIIGSDRHWTAFCTDRTDLLADLLVNGNSASLPLAQMVCSRSELVEGGWRCEGWYERLNGRRRYVVLDAAPIRNNSGETVAVIETVQDITELKLAEQSLRESEERYRQLFEHNPHPMWAYDLETLAFLAVNNAAIHHYGYTRDEFLAMTIKDIRPPEDVPMLLENIARVTQGIDESGVWRHITKNGTVILVEITSHTLEFGSRPAEIVLAHDVTEKIGAEEALLRSEERYRSIFDGVEDIIYSIATDASFVTLNRAFAEVTGWEREEWIGRDFTEIIHPEDLPTVRELFLTGMRGDPVPAAEFRIRNVRGDFLTLENAASPQIESGKVVGLRGIARNISGRKRVEGALIKLSQAIHQSPLSVTITGPTGIIEYANSKKSLLYGYEPGEALGRRAAIFDPECTLAEDAEKIWSRVSAGNSWSGIFTGRRKSGESFWGQATISPVKNLEEGISHYIIFEEDITERKSLEEQLRQSQKMEAIGTLVGGIAHDFNNILTAIIGFATLTRQRLGDDDTSAEYVDQILAGGERAARLTQSLLAYSRKQVSTPVAVDLNNVIRGAERLLRRLVPESISLTFSLAGVPLMMMADSCQIDQILMNLIVNARDAMPFAGELRIATEMAEASDIVVAAHGSTDARYLVLAVADTGVGMDAHTRERMFEPFFTTKEVGKGTGLGLSMVYGIVEQHGGFIDCQSEPGSGTVFRIYFPLINADVPDNDASAGNVFARGDETILLVEDDEGVRTLTRKLLEEVGYRVIVAVDGQEAVAKFSEHCHELSLAIVDVIMPKLGGLEVCRRMFELSPEARVLFVSGYTADIKPDSLLLNDRCDFLPKPIKPCELLSKVRDVLDKG